MDAVDAVNDIGGVTINLGVDVNGVVGVGGGDSPASLDIGTVDALSASLHARQDSLLSGGRRRNLGSDDKFTHILISFIVEVSSSTSTVHPTLSLHPILAKRFWFLWCGAARQWTLSRHSPGRS